MTWLLLVVVVHKLMSCT